MTAAPTTGWQVLRTDAGEHLTPESLPADGWLGAVVPGGIGASPAVLAAHPDAAATADAHAWWLRRTVHVTDEPSELVLDGIGTYATVFVDGSAVATSDNAFRGHVLPLALEPGVHDLAVRIGALSEVTPPRKPRARWRSSLLPDATMRWRRSPHLGRIPSWQGAMPYVGIIGQVDIRSVRPRIVRVSTDTRGTDGLVEVLVDGPLDGTLVRVGDVAVSLDPDGLARIVVPDAPRWRPHTHGTPHTAELVLTREGEVVQSRVIGWSDIEIRDQEGMPQVLVDGESVFVRGACWVPTDTLTWVDDPARVEADLRALRDAGMNAVRITGTNRYEPQGFWDAAARLGLLVWHDIMLATFDPPEDADWLAGLESELHDQLGRLQGRPNVLAVCGGTETEQQPTLMGIDPAAITITAIHEVLPRVAAEALPGTPVVTSSPSGGPLPTSIASGFSHYFGVGAYLRPLDDARSARVAFASEALAFAIPPERASVAEDYPAGVTDVRDDDWRDGVPSDRGVEWGFDDVTDHYVTDLFGVRRDDVDADRWLDLERAAVTHAMTRTLAVWRSPGSPTGGAFVLAHADLRRGPGWGLIDHHGRPKAPLQGLPDVLAPTALLLVDHGLDGLWLDIVHDSPAPLAGTLTIEAYAAGERPVGSAEIAVDGPARIHVERALGGFRDLTYAWRFGDRYYRAVHVRLESADGAVIAEQTYLLGPATAGPAAEPGLTAVAARAGDVTDIVVTATDLVEFVHLDAPGLEPSVGWFHLAPGRTRTIRATGEPTGPVVVRSTSHAPYEIG